MLRALEPLRFTRFILDVGATSGSKARYTDPSIISFGADSLLMFWRGRDEEYLYSYSLRQEVSDLGEDDGLSVD